MLKAIPHRLQMLLACGCGEACANGAILFQVVVETRFGLFDMHWVGARVGEVWLYMPVNALGLGRIVRRIFV